MKAKLVHTPSSVLLSTANGLSASLVNGTLAKLAINECALPMATPEGFVVIDQADPEKRRQRFEPVAKETDNPLTFRGVCQEAELEIESLFVATPTSIAVRGKVTNRRSGDRALSLAFSLPIDARGWRWDDDIRRNRTITKGLYEKTEPAAAGSGRMSVYPLAVIRDEQKGLALAMDLMHPAQFQISYDADAQQFTLNFDLALVPESSNFPNAAHFAFHLFPCDPAWGFRSAYETYMQIFPDAYAIRSRDQGIWMPFSLISEIEQWQDFGFRYHEGGEADHAFDRQHGILPFRYTEPFTWWMSMPEGMPRTYEAARAEQHSSFPGNFHRRCTAWVNSSLVTACPIVFPGCHRSSIS